MISDLIRERGLLDALSNALLSGHNVHQHREALIAFYRRLGLYA
jgi:hypothetical protein